MIVIHNFAGPMSSLLQCNVRRSLASDDFHVQLGQEGADVTLVFNELQMMLVYQKLGAALDQPVLSTAQKIAKAVQDEMKRPVVDPKKRKR